MKFMHRQSDVFDQLLKAPAPMHVTGPVVSNRHPDGSQTTRVAHRRDDYSYDARKEEVN